MKIKKIISSLLTLSLTVSSLCVFSAERFEHKTDNSSKSVEFTYINSDYTAMDFGLIIKNEAGTPVYFNQIKSDLEGRVTDNVAVGDSGLYSIQIYPMGSPVPYTDEFFIFTDDDLNRLWEIATASSSHTQIASSWDEISIAFSLSISENTDADILSQVIASGRHDFGQRSDGSVAEYKSHIANCELLAQLNAATKSNAYALLSATFDLIRSADSDYYAQLITDYAVYGDYAAALYAAKASTVFTVEEEIELLKECIEKAKTQKALDGLNAIVHSSLINEYITNEDNAKSLGITDLLADYNELGSTASVDSALQGKNFASKEAVREAMSEAITTAQNAPIAPDSPATPSYRPSGGGSFGGSSPAPNLNTVPKADDSTPGTVPEFTDIAHHIWAHSAIATLSQKGIITGRGNNIFAPDDNVTRAEFAKMLVLALDITDNGEDAPFDDVSDSDWFASYARIAAANGIVMGADGNFMPYSNITRQDAAVMIYRAAAISGGTMPEFTDKTAVADYAYDAVAALSSSGIIKGMDNGSFAPLNGLTRAQAAVLLARVMEVK